MLVREEAIQKLKDYWGVNEFTFLAKFEVPYKQRENDARNAFGFFNELYWNKNRIYFPPSEFDTKNKKFASCYSKKGVLKHNEFYIITAELNSDDKRLNKPFGLTLKKAKKATFEEIDTHLSLVSEDELYLGYINFISDDRTHAYVTVIDELTSKGVKMAKGTKGDIMLEVPSDLTKDQILIISKGNKKKVKYISNNFSGYLFNETIFVDTDSLKELFYLENVNRSPIDVLISSRPGSKEKTISHEKVSVKIRYDNSIIKLEKNDVISDYEISSIENILVKYLPAIIKQARLCKKSKSYVNLFNQLDSHLSFQVYAKEYFESSLLKLNEDLSSDSLTAFLLKWTVITPDLIRISNIKNIEFNDLYINLWIEKKIPNAFFEDTLLDCFVSIVSSGKETLDALFKRIDGNQTELIKVKFKEIFGSHFIIDSIEVYDILNELLAKFYQNDSNEYRNLINDSIDDKVKYELWVRGEGVEAPIDFAIQFFEKLQSHQQEDIIPLLTDEQLIPLMQDLQPIDNPEIEKRVEGLQQEILFEKLQAVAFDIESDKKEIFEIAWNEGHKWYSFAKETVQKGLEKFKNVANQKNILVGHNILNFDLIVLQDLEQVCYNESLVWDTLQIEKILSPDLKTYALKTKHTAKEDAELTLHLFKNQLWRIMQLDQKDADLIKVVISEEVFAKVMSLKNELTFKLNLVEINKNKLKFFRPQPQTNPFLVKLNEDTENSKADVKIILGTSNMTYDLLCLAKVQFAFDLLNKIDFQRLDINRIKSSSSLEIIQKAQLTAYIVFCNEKGLIPYWFNVSSSIRIEIEEKIDVWNLFDAKPLNSVKKRPIFLTPGEIEKYFENINSVNNTELFVLQPQLISISQKALIKKFDIEQLKAKFQENYFWMKFSGGQSVVALNTLEVECLGIESNEVYDNYWIEKYQYGKYRVYGNKNWEKLISELPIQKVQYVEIGSNLLKKDKVHCAKFKINKQAEFNITRFNPESIYRSRYWVIQKRIVDQITQSGSSVLLIQRYEEIVVLNKYFIDLGYYIPEPNISLGRRLELLHRFKKSKKILIAHLDSINKVLRSNHTNPINLIVDSFNLVDPYYCSMGTSFFKETQNEGTYKGDSLKSYENDTEDTEENLSGFKKEVFLKDNFFLLKLLKPKVDHFRNLLHLNHPENSLWLLDPRLEDFNQYVKQWDIILKEFSTWVNKEEYNEDVKKAEIFITSTKPTEIPFSVDEIMEILSDVFLEGKPWYDSQKKYLNKIIPGDGDWLISLPTGAGKSLLFQGPAIFKSAFTNRLTIVVSPLKALMEDQVMNLWDKGFYGSVEYLNSDRSSDVQLINRSIAGGELSLLFVTPERFRSRSFLNALDSRIVSDGGLEYFVFDEAHCVSQWGHDFRPDYFNCAKVVWKTKVSSEYNTPLLLFSATVSEKIYQDFNNIFS